MTVEKIEVDTLKTVLSHFDFEYLNNPGQFLSFINYLPELENFREAAKNRSKTNVDRELLIKIILDNYKQASVEITPTVRENIDSLLNNNTFTVTTAHQPCLLGGPFYFFLKIASLISLSHKINGFYSTEFKTVPVFVIGGEDHDFEEISKVSIEGREIKWEHNLIGGPVGRMNHEGIYEVLSQLENVVGHTEYGIKVFNIFKRAYENTGSLAQATLYWINEIFAEFGLIVINMDGKLAKSAFSAIMQEEVKTSISEKVVTEAQKDLENRGFKAQAFVREINLYKIGDRTRQRILKLEGKQFRIEGEERIFELEELLVEIENNPELFSPNVITRPLLQETLLPNLAYLGGGGELAYWMERKKQFEHFGVHYPILIRRDSVSWLSKSMSKKISKLNLPVASFFSNRDHLIREYLTSNSTVSLDAQEEKNSIIDNLERISAKADKIDPTVGSALRAESSRIARQIDQMEGRLLRAEKQKNEVAINQIDFVIDKLFPGGKLQERHESFIPLYILTKGKLANLLIEHINPLDRKWNILTEEEKHKYP